MRNFLAKGRVALLVIFSVLIIGQVTKVIIKTHMYWYESMRTIDWFYIYFTKNNGMAFGLEIFGKLFLTSFRIVAVGIIGWLLYRFAKHRMKTGFIVCVLLVLTEALGNIVDSAFCGVLFNESTYLQLATFMPEGDGCAPLLYGRVVDIFYFPIIETNWSVQISSTGGKYLILFSSIFSFADAIISCGIIALLLFCSKYLNDSYRVIKKL